MDTETILQGLTIKRDAAQAEVNLYQASIDNISGKIASQVSSITGLQDAIVQKDTQIMTLTTEKETVIKEVDTLKTSIASLDPNSTNLKDQVLSIQSDIAKTP